MLWKQTNESFVKDIKDQLLAKYGRIQVGRNRIFGVIYFHYDRNHRRYSLPHPPTILMASRTMMRAHRRPPPNSADADDLLMYRGLVPPLYTLADLMESLRTPCLLISTWA